MFIPQNFNQMLRKYFILIFIFVILICIFFIPFLSDDNYKNSFANSSLESSDNQSIYHEITSNKICWPLPGYTRISSPFGYRGAPTAGATSFHGGIDIPAPEGTNITSAITGTVTRTGFMGSGGCSVVVQNNDYTVIFHHISPNYLVKPGDYVVQGQIIAQVGPKNIYGFANNPYKDSKGNPTNGATTGCHLHFTVKIGSKYINPLSLF